MYEIVVGVLCGIIVYQAIEKFRLISKNEKTVKDLLDRIMSVDYIKYERSKLDSELTNNSLKLELEKTKRSRPPEISGGDVIDQLKRMGKMQEV